MTTRFHFDRKFKVPWSNRANWESVAVTYLRLGPATDHLVWILHSRGSGNEIIGRYFRWKYTLQIGVLNLSSKETVIFILIHS